MAKKKKTKNFPDGRGERPADPNELARWIVEQSTTNNENQPNDSAEADSSDSYDQ